MTTDLIGNADLSVFLLYPLYPHTDKDGFTFRTMSVANNALVCPAVFWIVEEMRKRSARQMIKSKKKRRK